MQKFTKIISILLVVVMAVATVALTACDQDNVFVNPELPTTGTVTSNGGVVVGYGDYVYYVNGQQTDVESANKYTGEAKRGDIVRVKSDDLATILAMHNSKSSDKSEAIAEQVAKSVETVVPMFYYTNNTTDTSVNGMFIFGDKMYFTTPNPELTINGEKRTDELAIYSASLDGTNLQQLHSIQGNDIAVSLAEVEGVVYAMYEYEADLHSVNLANKEDKIVAEEVTGTKFQVNDGSVYYINEDKAICSYVAGSAEADTVVANDDKDNITYTIGNINQGKVYYTVDDSRDSTLKSPIYVASKDVASKVVFDSTPSDTYLGYGDMILLTGKTYNSTPAVYQLYLTSGDGIDKTYVLEQNSNTTAITFVSLIGDIFTYSIKDEVYTVDLSASSYTHKHIHDTLTSAKWSYVDQVEIGGNTYFFTMDSAGNVMCNDFDGDKTVSTNLTKLPVSQD